jgi:hypothetical protein
MDTGQAVRGLQDGFVDEHCSMEEHKRLHHIPFQWIGFQRFGKPRTANHGFVLIKKREGFLQIFREKQFLGW